MGPLWGIDLGGTKIEGVVLEDRDTPNILKRLRVPTEREKGYDHIIEQIVKIVEVLSSEVGIRPQKIGIGHPGSLEPSSQLIKNSNTIVLNNMPLKADLEQALNLPVVLANDANCFAIAEAEMGAVKSAVPNAEVVFGVIMGTGVGGDGHFMEEGQFSFLHGHTTLVITLLQKFPIASLKSVLKMFYNL